MHNQSIIFTHIFRLQDDRPINFSVPTGNFGDVYAGYLSKKMGLPINKLIVATNQNDILHRAISNGKYEAETVYLKQIHQVWIFKLRVILKD